MRFEILFSSMIHDEQKIKKVFISIIKFGIYLSLLSPLVFSGKFIYPFIIPKTTFFQIIIEVVFFFYVLLALSDRTYRPKWNYLNISLVIFFSLLVATAILGVDVYQSFHSTIERNDGIINLLHYVLFFFILTSVFRAPKDWLNIFYVILGVIVLQVLLGLGQFFNISFIYTQEEHRPQGSLGNPAYLASFLALAAFLTAFLYSETRHIKIRPILLFIIMLEVITLLLTENRGGVFGLVFGIIIFLLLNIIFAVDKKKKNIFLYALVSVIMLVVLLFSLRNTPIIKNSPLQRLTKTSFGSITVENRLINWDAGWQGFKERPLFGWGW